MVFFHGSLCTGGANFANGININAYDLKLMPDVPGVGMTVQMEGNTAIECCMYLIAGANAMIIHHLNA